MDLPEININWDWFLNLFKDIHLTMPSWDLFILVAFVIVAGIYGFSLGRERVLGTLLSIYISLAVISTLPYLDELAELVKLTQTTFQTLFFLFIFLILFALLSRSAILSGIGGNGNWWQALLFSILHIGLLLSIILSFLPTSILSEAIPITKLVFVSAPARCFWLLMPILSLLVFR